MLAKSGKIKKGKAKQNIFFSIFLAILFFLVVGFLIFTNWKVSRRRAELTAQIANLTQEVAILEQKNKELKEKMSEAGSQEYLEEVARNQLGLRKPGEQVMVVQKEEEKKEEPKEEEKTWWEIIKSIWER